MNDDTELTVCPVCGKEITIVLDWEDADYSVGLFGGWWGGIAIEDAACGDHMTREQEDALIAAAVARKAPPAETELEAEIARINVEEIDAMRDLDDWNRRLMDAVVQWHDDVPY